MVGNALKLNCEMRSAERFLPARGGGKWNDVGKRGGSQPEVIRAAAEKLGGRGLESIRVSTEDAFVFCTMGGIRPHQDKGIQPRSKTSGKPR